MYDELVKRLRDAAKMSDALAVLLPHSEGNAMAKLDNEAADAIEELLDFAHFVASNGVVSDEEWDNNMLVFPEVASRKLNKLGIVEKDGACWSYEPPKEE